MSLRPGKDPVCEGRSTTTLLSNLFVCAFRRHRGRTDITASDKEQLPQPEYRTTPMVGI